MQGFELFGAETTCVGNTGSSVDVSTEAKTESLASLLRHQGSKTSGKLFWRKFNIFGFVLLLAWMPKLGSGSKLEEGGHLISIMDLVSC